MFRAARDVNLMLCWLLAVALALATPAAATPTDALQAELEKLRQEAAFPGAVAAVVMPDGTPHTAAVGEADVQRKLPMTPDHRMLSGSTGKSFVAAVALALAQEGRLNLDAPIARWLGDRPWFPRLPNGAAITTRMFLRHRSGLPDHIHLPAFQAAAKRRITGREGDADYAFPPEALVGFVLDAEPLFAPGAGYAYSDTNYILAGLVIEAVTGRDYEAELRERFLTPLDLSQTAPAEGRRFDRLASGYIRGEAPFGLPEKVAKGGVLAYNPATEWTGGGLITNARDLARWAWRLYAGAAMPGDYRGELLDGVPKDASQQARYGEAVRYGLGVTIRQTPLGPAYGHRGWTPGYLSVFEYYPRHRLAVALQINELGDHDMSHYAVRLARAIIAARD
ncbi:serine hydrolase domain-containing protein [Dichotomicrobium thermohalophilum]|uniref:D-alanyl-D-alanine carboxypeptidase n=1 Tax=Dichotomicrobium thermohalophilum TaxID=933063 RepID=A0A397QAU9_9HYPH|nr:serine hydrolase domain-containing protein [Dichotomicrobium thermohalophilum]RIA55244.1 D-alanyl-D-alanine carboxypeptidase [Dichotomicrobium thermohalophilum]